MKDARASLAGKDNERRVLIVDDERDFVSSLVDILESRAYRTETAYSATGALDKIKEFSAQVALLDIRLGKVSGIDLLAKLKKVHPALICVMMTAYAAIDTAIEALQAGAYDYLRKPFHPPDLLATLDRCFEKIRLREEKKQAEDALKESEEKYRDLYENAPNAYFSVNADDGSILRFNAAAMQLFDYDRTTLMGMKVFDLYPDTPDGLPKAREVFKRFLSGEPIRNQPLQMKRKDGNLVWTSLSVEPVRDRDGNIIESRSMVTDISDHKRLETQLQRTQKMEAIVTLAGGIAHEFNNALFGLTGNIELLQLSLRADETVKKYADAMLASSQRMIKLTNHLLAYARGGKYHPETIYLSEIIEDTLPILMSSIDPCISIETEFEGDMAKVEGDRTQMQLVLSALLANASEAITGEGRIRIHVRNEVIDAPLAKSDQGFKAGRYVCLTIEDDGQGMEAETMDRLFDPFFTTKLTGRGLGMSATYGIVKNHNGWIFVDSEPGSGTVVRIYLPVVDAQIEEVKQNANRSYSRSDRRK
jgi:PAS domain S-box-containing protein